MMWQLTLRSKVAMQTNKGDTR